MQLSENIKMTNFHLTFLWIFPYNMGNNDRKGADPGMRKVDHNKQQKRESLLDSTLRFSFGVFNTEDEVDYCLEVLRELLPVLRRYRRA